MRDIHEMARVAANIELRKRLRNICKENALKLFTPYSQKLTGDNAAMIGIAAYLNPKNITPSKIDRVANLKLT